MSYSDFTSLNLDTEIVNLVSLESHVFFLCSLGLGVVGASSHPDRVVGKEGVLAR